MYIILSQDKSLHLLQKQKQYAVLKQGSGNWGATAAGMQHAPGNGHTSHDESPDMDDGVGSPHGGHSGNKRGGNTKTKRNPRQQDQNKQVCRPSLLCQTGHPDVACQAIILYWIGGRHPHCKGWSPSCIWLSNQKVHLIAAGPGQGMCD